MTDSPSIPARSRAFSRRRTKQAFASLVSGARKSTGVQISINTVDHDTFHDDITSYLQGTPNDLATWFAGYRMDHAEGRPDPRSPSPCCKSSSSPGSPWARRRASVAGAT
jgi:hypothetical protein